METIPFYPIAYAVLSFLSFAWVSSHQAQGQAASAEVSAEVFPLGWYDVITNTGNLAQMKADGMNVVVPYVRGEVTNETVETYMDAAAANGMKVLLEIPRERIVWRFNYSSTLEQARADLRTYVNRFQDHPALLAWYLYDEPNVSTDPNVRRATNPVALQRAYDVIKTEDPQRQIATVYNRLPSSDPNQTEFDLAYLEPTDVVMFDYYPVDAGYVEFQAPKWTDFGAFVVRGTAIAADAPGKEYWKVLQGYGENAQGVPQFNKRLPTINEERYMLYTSIVSKATGIFFWAYYRANRPWIDNVLKPILEEFSPLRPAIAAGALENSPGEAPVRHTSPDNLPLRYQLFRDTKAKKFFLVVVNESETAGTATLGVRPNRGVASIRDIRNNRIIPFANPNPDASLDYTFTYSFSAYGTAVLELQDKNLDLITSVTPPAAIVPGTNATIRVAYTAATDRDIYTTVQRDTYPHTRYGTTTKVDVSAGSGTVEISVPIDANTPVAPDAYQFQTFITPDGHGWFDRLHNLRIGNIDAVASSPTTATGAVSIRAKGSVGSEQMSLLVDGAAVQRWTVATTADNYIYEGYTGGGLSVRFDNDGSSTTGGDLNLAVNYIRVCGVKYESNGVGVVRTGCGVDNDQGFAWLWCSGSFDFGEVGCSSSALTGAGISQRAALPSATGQAGSLRSYPNPASEQLTLQAEGSQDYRVSICDLRGQVVMHRQHLKGQTQLDIAHLRPGVYIVNVNTDDGQQQQRLVVE